MSEELYCPRGGSNRSYYPDLKSTIAAIVLNSVGMLRSSCRVIATMFVVLLTILSDPHAAWTQISGVGQINDDLHEFIQRQYVLGRLDSIQTGFLPYSSLEARSILESLSRTETDLSVLERIKLQRYLGTLNSDEESSKSFSFPGNRIYRNNLDLFSWNGKGYFLAINPFLNSAIGYFDLNSSDARSGKYTRLHTGIKISGILNDTWFFESRVAQVAETVVDPSRIDNASLPRQRWARFAPSSIRVVNGETQYSDDRSKWDYDRAAGVVGFRKGKTEIRLGRDRYRLGFGLNSLFLSNYASEYDHLLVTTSFFRIHYSYLLASMRDKSSAVEDGIADQKTGIFHRIEVRLGKRVNVELFQTTILAADPDRPTSRSFDIGMLNPLLHLRQFEKDFDGFGNKLVGAGIQFRPAPGGRAYFEFLLDEFVRSEIYSGNGFWGNKWALLLGFEVADPLDLPIRLQLEYAQARPYTYSHHQSSTSFSHYDDVLAHPAGSNFRDFTLLLIVDPYKRISLRSISSLTISGENTDTENFGSDPRRTYDDRIGDFGISMLQGPRSKRFNLDTIVSYELVPRTWIEFAVRYYSQKVSNERETSQILFTFGLRSGLSPGYSRN